MVKRLGTHAASRFQRFCVNSCPMNLSPLHFTPVFLFFVLNHVLALDAPIFQERFNEQGNVEFVNGAQLGAAGSGVSGKQDDTAYTAPTVDASAKMQPAGVVASPQLPASLDEVTVTLWYKVARTPVDATTLLNAGGIYLLWQGDQQGAWNMRLEMPIEKKMRAWFNPGKARSITAWNAEGQWIFYALTWKRSSGEAVVYQGTSSDGAAEQRRWQSSEAVSALENALYSGAPAIIGNSYDAKSMKPGMRAFAGDLDNIRIFGTALSAEDIEKVRAADASNSQL